VISYLALGLPAILAGLLVVHGGLTTTADEIGVAVMALAGVTAVSLLIGERRGAAKAAAVRPRRMTPVGTAA